MDCEGYLILLETDLNPQLLKEWGSYDGQNECIFIGMD